MKSIILSTLLLVACVAAYVSYNRYTASSIETIRLGTMSGWPPYVYLTKQGDYEGFDIAAAHHIAQRLGKQLTIQDMDTGALLTALDQNKVDFIMTGLCITPRRRQKITMIPYQGENICTYPLVFYKSIPKTISSLDDIKNIPNASICVEGGSSQDDFLQNYEGQFTIKRLDPALALLELVHGKATALLLEQERLEEFKKTNPQLVALTINLDEKNYVLGNGIGVNKNNQVLSKKIEIIIEQLRQEGILSQLEQRYFNHLSISI